MYSCLDKYRERTDTKLGKQQWQAPVHHELNPVHWSLWDCVKNEFHTHQWLLFFFVHILEHFAQRTWYAQLAHFTAHYKPSTRGLRDSVVIKTVWQMLGKSRLRACVGCHILHHILRGCMGLWYQWIYKTFEKRVLKFSSLFIFCNAAYHSHQYFIQTNYITYTTRFLPKVHIKAFANINVDLVLIRSWYCGIQDISDVLKSNSRIHAFKNFFFFGENCRMAAIWTVLKFHKITNNPK